MGPHGLLSPDGDTNHLPEARSIIVYIDVYDIVYNIVYMALNVGPPGQNGP